MTAMSLAAMSDNRFVLGLGVSGPQVIEGWHGIRFDRPVQRMREIIEIVRQRGARRAARVRGQDLRAAPARRRGQGAPLGGAAGADHPDLPRHALAEEPRVHRRGRGRLARHLVHAGARPRVLRSTSPRAPRARAARSPTSICRRAAWLPSPTTSERLIAARKPGLAFTLGAMGSARAQLLQRRLPPRRLRGRGRRGAAALARRASATRPRPACPTRWCSRPISSAPRPWCASASRAYRAAGHHDAAGRAGGPSPRRAAGHPRPRDCAGGRDRHALVDAFQGRAVRRCPYRATEVCISRPAPDARPEPTPRRFGHSRRTGVPPQRGYTARLAGCVALHGTRYF